MFGEVNPKPKFRQPYELLQFFPGVPVSGATLSQIAMTRPVRWDMGMPGFQGYSQVNASAPATLTINRNGSSVGTVNFATSTAVATITLANAVLWLPGDILTIVNQGSADATLANMSVSLVGHRTL